MHPHDLRPLKCYISTSPRFRLELRRPRIRLTSKVSIISAQFLFVKLTSKSWIGKICDWIVRCNNDIGGPFNAFDVTQ
jgi:hypothetical protein